VTAEDESNNIFWIEQAACKGLTHLFYGHPSERPQSAYKRELKAGLICDSCSVFSQCRQYARQNGEFGYWAGENEYQRAIQGFQPRVNVRLRRATLEYYVNQNNTQLGNKDEF
jgi:WhiB family redox-sensing transcriptional regulator